MSEFRFSSSAHPRLALAAFLLLGGAILLRGAFALATEIATLRADVAASRQTIAEAATQAATASARALPVYRVGSAHEARARFQSDLQALAEAHRYDVETVGTAEMRIVNGMVRMGVSLSGAIDEDALGDFLVALRAAEPAILVDALAVRRGRGRANAGEARRVPLEIELAAYAVE